MKCKYIKKSVNIKTSFSANRLTNYSGTLPSFNFMLKIGFFDLISKISLNLGHNIQYHTSSIFGLVVLGIMSGMNRVSKIESFSHDALIQELFGLTSKIDANTIANRFNRFDFKQTNELMECIGAMSAKVHRKLGTYSDILDMDSSVRTVFGKQEGAERGYNPHKKGALSYHPLLVFLNSTRECLLSWLRPGDTYTANNASEFIKQALALLPCGIKKILIRADSGFFDGKILSVIEAHPQAKYLIKVKMKNLSAFLSGRNWESIPAKPNYQMAEFEHRCTGWDKTRKFTAIRIKKLRKEDGTLFDIPVYDYFCYVTNVNEHPLEIHYLYGDRGTSENWIEAVKNQMFAGSMLTQDFWTNEVFWQASIAAYNLSLWMRALTDNNAWRQEPATFRLWFIQLAGKMVKTGRQIHLNMYNAFHYKDWWRRIEQGVANLDFR